MTMFLRQNLLQLRSRSLVTLRSLSSSSSSAAPQGSDIRKHLQELGKLGHPQFNVTENIIGKVGRNLHLLENHPLNIIKTKIEAYCDIYAAEKGIQPFHKIDSLPPLVDTKSCFDDLRVPPEHVSRSKSDTYYVDYDTGACSAVRCVQKVKWSGVEWSAVQCSAF